MTDAVAAGAPEGSEPPAVIDASPGQGPTIDKVEVSVYMIPTDAPESDGTMAWDRTTLVIVEPRAGGMQGVGYSYADANAARLIVDNLASVVVGRNAFDIAAIWLSMVGSVRNIGRPGIAATAISAVDNALWDLKARRLGVPLVDLLGSAREAIPASRQHTSPNRSCAVSRRGSRSSGMPSARRFARWCSR